MLMLMRRQCTPIHRDKVNALEIAPSVRHSRIDTYEGHGTDMIDLFGNSGETHGTGDSSRAIRYGRAGADGRRADEPR